MSRTEIYVVGDQVCEQVGFTENAWRGAMYVWHDIAKRYFGLAGFPSFDESMMHRIWNAGNEKPITLVEKVVLASTMDRVTVKHSDLNRLADLFDEYAKSHPNSSIGQQSEIIKAVAASGKYDGLKLAWCQTSVCEFHFKPDYDDDDNPSFNSLSDAWDLFEQIDSTDN